jgi:tRNA threonylcarbamoyladenosine biosynthesis protein TsaE
MPLNDRKSKHKTSSPEATFALGESIGHELAPGDAVLLHGGLGAGKTLLTKGIMAGLGFDVDEVTSPSFTLVNLYRSDRLDVYHIDLWRTEPGSDAAFGVGLDELVEQDGTAVVIEWAERLGDYRFPGRVIEITISGDGDDGRSIEVITKVEV